MAPERGTGLVQKWGALKYVFVGSKSTISRFGECFLMVSTVWSVSYLLFLNSWCPPCPDICKIGGGTCPMELAPLVKLRKRIAYSVRIALSDVDCV